MHLQVKKFCISHFIAKEAVFKDVIAVLLPLFQCTAYIYWMQHLTPYGIRNSLTLNEKIRINMQDGFNATSALNFRKQVQTTYQTDLSIYTENS